MPTASSIQLLDELSEAELFLFDFDGTLVDVISIYWQAHARVLSRYGTALPDVLPPDIYGKTETDIADFLECELGADMTDVDAYRRDWLGEVVSIAEATNPAAIVRPYALGILERFSGIPRLLVSSQHPDVIDTVLSTCGLDGFFPSEKRFLCVECQQPKEACYRDPWAFVPTAEGQTHTGWMPGRTVVFEDEDQCLKAARNAGLTTVGIATHQNNGVLECDFLVDCRGADAR